MKKLDTKKIFKYAHLLTKEAISNSSEKDLSYSATFSLCLKAIYDAIAKEAQKEINSAILQKEKFPHVFKKSIEEMTSYFFNSDYREESAYTSVLKSMPHRIEAQKIQEKEAAEYYERTGGAVTMC